MEDRSFRVKEAGNIRALKKIEKALRRRERQEEEKGQGSVEGTGEGEDRDVVEGEDFVYYYGKVRL